MKKMSIESQVNSNAGSVLCDTCGYTTWGVESCKSHIRYWHRCGHYTWYQWGPYGRITRANEHYVIIGGGWAVR